MEKGIGRYQIIGELGSGAMALVYKAFDPSIHRTLAVKILRQERCVDSEYRTRFLRESKAAGNLSHPNIVTIHDVGESGNRPYIIMELLDGKSLDQLMKSGHSFTIEEIISIGIQLASALDYAHNHGVVHRDIKPSNIVYSSKADNTQNIKITDFGIARVEDTNLTQHTQIGEILGTPQYMSPEQVLGQKVDGRSDLFSVGVILYQLLTGKKAFKGDTIATLLFQIATEDPDSIEQLAPSTPLQLRLAVERLLKKQPEKRFQSGKDLVQALKSALHDFEDKALKKGEHRIVPLRVKWTLVMALVVSITMMISVTVIYQKQRQAMTAQTVDYGGSLVKFIATESAVPILSEDWVSIELFVQEVSERQEFSYLTIIDHQSIIRGDNNLENIGNPYQKPSGLTLISDIGETKVFGWELPNHTKAFDFATPILFQNKVIGQVHLGLSQDSLQKVARFTMIMMIVLMLTTIATVSVITYILGLYLSSPIKFVKNSLDEIAAGNLNYRISRNRNDEFGQLFLAFDHMVESLQKRNETSLRPKKV